MKNRTEFPSNSKMKVKYRKNVIYIIYKFKYMHIALKV